MDIVILNSGPATAPSAKDTLTVYRTLGAYKIAHSCRKENYSVKVIDHVLHFSKEDLIKMLRKYINTETSVLGISTTFINEWGIMPQHLIEAVAEISADFPRIKIIMGGYFTIAAKKITEFNTFAIISQYGEDIFLDVVNFINGRGKEPKYTIELHSITNKVLKVYSEPLVHRHKIEEDDFKFHPDDDIVPKETLPLEISRGCIFKCKFCNHLMLGRGKLDYLRSFDLVKEELIYNYENWGTTSYYIICDTFNDTVYKMTEWHKMVTSLPFKIKYTAYLRADLLDRFREVPYLLKDSGLVTAYHGIESLAREGSLAIGKGWSGQRAKEFIPELYHNIWNKEVLQTLSFIVGLPGDTRENNLETVKWFRENDLYHIAFHPLGITNNKEIKNLSEFERNYEKYGYRFESEPRNLTSYGKWINDYWDVSQVLDFIKIDLNPRIKPKGQKIYSSWQILQYIGLGFNEKMFRNKKLIIPNDACLNFIQEYKNLLLSK